MAIQSAENCICPNIGDRIECNGDLGTVKYIGSVDGYPSLWLGIDWDDPERGKHNGCVNGKQYFEATHPKSGSFVRPEKVRCGQSLVQAITSRYGKRDDELTAKINQQKLLKLQQEINAPFVEMVGFDTITNKQSDFSNLKVVNARMQNVNGAGDDLELKTLCPNICELDISKNLINNWKSVFLICAQLETLEWLNVSQNLLQLPDDYSSYCFPQLKTLVCGSMRLTWNDIVQLSQIFPKLEELRVPSNSISNLDTPEMNNFQCLKILDLEGNDISNWEEICKLSVIPSLEHLIIENIGLKSIRFEKCENQRLEIFKNLRRLAISNNFISDWESIGALNKLSNLEDLRLLRNPILETESEGTRTQIIIARIATLKVLNATEILDSERKGAEYDYLKKYGLEWLSVKNTDKEREFLEKHNRYLEFIQKYGAVDIDELTVPKNMKSSLVEVIIQYENHEIEKKIPNSILIQKLIMMIQRIFKLEERPKLLYISSLQPDVKVVLDDEFKELNFFSVNNGDKIIAVT